MKNTIAERVFDFLKDFPPFNFLDKDELYSISANVQVIYLENNSYIFKQNETIHDSFYIVKDGAIGVFRDDTVLVDKCDEGDIFGLRAIIAKDDYLLSAKAIEESIVYSISSEILETIIKKNDDANKFLAIHIPMTIKVFCLQILKRFKKTNRVLPKCNLQITLKILSLVN